ncbi:MAG: Cof-type HAD-IIB family hydrolase [Actinobacteria bacterium]|nr:Cof-type HAD-IIB family hydrolase [Actinomycetota bacterium]MSW24399.1 Cof-type HAD-IIB family hydrolase [Actinomycetota bacterium]MSX29024.1 Cof-type HAD-IIB family hydrolase [Actinomycetota bacterium]MSX43306.1 Cof-type HAD-IIB family hydrolase [Actinomycetota bacterium]MSX97935.1 Cof-type HAD-IIB family hydrolase [Actinomycetota bacterium]
MEGVTIVTRLIASDLDGTFLQTGGTVSPENVAAIARAHASGLETIFVTGRPTRWMRQITEMTGHEGLALVCNGALLMDLMTQETIYAELLSADAGLKAAAALQELDPDISFAVELDRHDVSFLVDDKYKPRWEIKNTPPATDVESMFGTDIVVKLLARPSDRIQQNADQFLVEAQKALDGIVDVTHSNFMDLMIEMSSLGVNKGTGLEKLATSKGMTAADVAAIGDMPNDVPMVAWAGRGAAVDNAHEWVKAAANEHVPSNDEHGVAVFIDRIIAS